MLIPVLVFVGAFAVAALLLSLNGADAADAKKQTLARLAAMTMSDELATQRVLPLRKQEANSSIPLLNRWLSRADLAPQLREMLSQADLAWTPARLLLTSAVCFFAAGTLVYLRTGVPPLAILVGTVFSGAPFAYVLVKRNKRRDQFEQDLPGALDLIVSALRSGNSLISAVGMVAKETPDPIGREFRICYEEQHYGLELRTAMENLARRVPIQDVRIVVTAILIQKETGGNLAEVLEKCAHLIRERFRLKREIRSKTAQGRLTGMILTGLPLVLGFLLYLLRPELTRLLWTRPFGVKMLYSGAVMMIVGGIIINKIVRIRI